ncbi:DEAD/DEAH box helicase, partial [Corynebacterium variabile]|uniref:DEAD/DEAH box helicase n=1 Tax=Corynebacterium variabile TaxID=1727 RepID=UPI0028B00992
MTETENVSGDENQPDTSQSTVTQNDLLETSGESPLSVGDIVGADDSENTADRDVTEENPADNNDTETESGFAGLGLPDRILAAVEKVGYVTPSPIQAATIPAVMDGHDVVGLAQTGTGKTAA